jgi:hypothetical protein
MEKETVSNWGYKLSKPRPDEYEICLTKGDVESPANYVVWVTCKERTIKLLAHWRDFSCVRNMYEDISFKDIGDSGEEVVSLFREGLEQLFNRLDLNVQLPPDLFQSTKPFVEISM